MQANPELAFQSPWRWVAFSLVSNNENYTKIILAESEQPTQWYNVIPDLPEPPPPPLHPGTFEPADPDDLPRPAASRTISNSVSQPGRYPLRGTVRHLRYRTTLLIADCRFVIADCRFGENSLQTSS